jgi:hypothetical protein
VNVSLAVMLRGTWSVMHGSKMSRSDGMKRLFDPNNSHLSVWIWEYDSKDP